MHDILIIGGGAAGMTAAIYTTRKKLSTAIITIDVGGQTNLTSNIENYPGVDGCHGIELMQRFKKQAVNQGTEFIMGKVSKVDKTADGFVVTLANKQQLACKCLIVAYGKVPRTLNLPKEDEFLGRGVSTCITNPEEFENKTVAVIGGGNSACESALRLSSIAKKVYLVHRRDTLRADEVTVSKLKQTSVDFVLNHQPVEFRGGEKLTHLVVEDVNSGQRKDLKIDEAVVEIGFIVDTKILQHLVKVNEKQEIMIDERTNTNCPGLFACGDITTIPFKQTVISAGEGAKAGLEAYRFLTGGKGVSIDWTH